MTIAESGTPVVPAVTTAPVAEAPALVAGSPEHRAAMVAAYDAQFATPAPVVPEVVPVVPVVDPLIPEVKPTDPPVKTAEEIAAEAAAAATPKSLGDLFDSGDFTSGFAAETLPDNLSKSLQAAGLKGEQITAIHAQFREGQAAIAREQTSGLHEAAGGKAAFDQLIAWGKQNFTAEQAKFYDGELNGPNARDVIALLQVKASTGRDPKLAHGTGGSSAPVLAFRDASEMQAAMRDPRYQASPAFRAEVGERLRHARF